MDAWVAGHAPTGLKFSWRDRIRTRRALARVVPRSVGHGEMATRAARLALGRAEAERTMALADERAEALALAERQRLERHELVERQFGPGTGKYLGPFDPTLDPLALLGLPAGFVGGRQIREALARERETCRRVGGPDLVAWIRGLEEAATSLLVGG